MKNYFKFIFVVALASAFTSCMKDDMSGDLPEEKSKVLEFVAGFNGEQKTSIDADCKTTWNTGDKVTFYNANGASEVASVSEEFAGKSSCIFTTSLDAVAPYYCAYGSVKGCEGGEMSVSLGTDQDGSWAGAQLAAAKSSDRSFLLKNLSSVISFELEKGEATSVEFTSVDKFSTQASVSFDSSNNPIVVNDEGGRVNTITVSTEGGAGKYYLAAFPDTLSSITINIVYASGNKTVVIDTPVALSAGKILNLGSIEDRETKTYRRIYREGFDETSGLLDDGGLFAYKSYLGKNPNGDKPKIYNAAIRLYQGKTGSYGNYLSIVPSGSDRIASVKVWNTSTYSSTSIAIQDASENFDSNKAVSLSKSSYYVVKGMDADSVRIYCCGTSKGTRLEIKAIEVTYSVDSRMPQSLSFPESSYEVQLGDSFTAPVVSGAKTSPVEYSSSDTKVASVDPSTGAVTLVAKGSCTITATAPSSAEYKAAKASYTLTVTSSATIGSIAEIIALASSNKGVDFTAKLTNAIVTKVYDKYAFLEDQSGALLIYVSGHSLSEGNCISGIVSGTVQLYDGSSKFSYSDYAYPELTALDYSKAEVTTVPEDQYPLTTITVAQFKSDWKPYFNRRVKFESVSVDTGISSSNQSGKISQNGSSLTIFNKSKQAEIESGLTGNLICFPSAHRGELQALIYTTDQFTEAGGEAEDTPFTRLSQMGYYSSTDSETPTAVRTYVSGSDQYSSSKSNSSRGWCLFNLESGRYMTVSLSSISIYCGAELTATVSVDGGSSEQHNVKVTKKTSSNAWLEDKTEHTGFIISLE